MARSVTPSTRKLSDAQRALLRQRHRDDLAALAVHAAAAEQLAAAQVRRAAAVAAADQTVKEASADLFAATRALVVRIGAEATAEATGTDIETVMRIAKSTATKNGRG
jgi:CRP-like cAMP-binding protein